MTLPASDVDLTDTALARSIDGGFSSRYAEVNGARLHYVTNDTTPGDGRPVLLLGGWPQTWWQWHKVMPALAQRHRVVAVDLRGMGGSSAPPDGYDKKTMAHDIRELVGHLGLASPHIVGHDIGAMVAYAYAANHPDAVGKIALLDAPHPDPSWYGLTLLPAVDQDVNAAAGHDSHRYLWWFALNQVRELPERLLDGRFRLLIDWLVDHLTADPSSVDERSRTIYANAYATPDAVRAGNSWYQTFPTDIVDEQTYGAITAPILGLGGDISNYGRLRGLLPAKGTDVRVVEIAQCGHYIPEEQPAALVAELVAFLD